MDTEKGKLPSVIVLKPFTPTEVVDEHGERLVYPNLEEQIGRHALLETAHWDSFLDAEPESPEELKAAQNLASYYLLKTSVALQASRGARRETWADRFTNANEELYDTELAMGAWESLFDTEISQAQESTTPAARRLIDAYQSLGFVPDNKESESTERSPEILPDTSYGEVIKTRYKDVLALIDEETYDPVKMGELFIKAFDVLAVTEGDEGWREWSVEFVEKDSLSVVSSKKIIRIGINRISESAQDMQQLLAHELLAHALRAQHAEKFHDSRLSTGLPGYLDTEEGLGIVHETLISGKVPAKAADRYMDIGIAKGLLGRQPTRKELINIVALRFEVREPGGKDFEKRAKAHINRLYRGTLGDESPERHGVFTKDAVYYVGYLKMRDYINSAIESGEAPDAIFDYLMAAKFDPANKAHAEIVKKAMQGLEHER
jgi:hypothetical protein